MSLSLPNRPGGATRPRLRLRSAARCALLLLCPAAGQAAHPLVTEDTGTQGLGKFQLEASAELTRDRPGGAQVKGVQPAAVLAYGLAANLDVELGRAYLRQRTDGALVKGGLDTALDFKWRFFERDGLSLALKPGLTFPNGDPRLGLGTGKTTAGGLAIVSREGKQLDLHAHASWRANRNSVGQRERLTQLAATAVFKVTEDWRAIADAAGSTNPERASRSALRTLTFALIHSPREDLDLDLGWRRAVGDPAIDRSLMFGVTLRW